MAFRSPQLASREWLHEHYVVQGLTIQRIGELAYAERTTVYAALRAHGIPRRKPAAINRWAEVMTKEYLADRMARGYTHREIAREVGCDPASVTRAKARHQLLTVSAARAEWLRKHYVDLDEGSTTIARKLGVQEDTVSRWLQAAGIAIKGPRGGRPKVDS